VPNERGLDRALDRGVRDIAVFGSVTETFAKRNLNRTVDESLAMFAPVVTRASAGGALQFLDGYFQTVAGPCHRHGCCSTSILRLNTGNHYGVFSASSTPVS